MTCVCLLQKVYFIPVFLSFSLVMLAGKEMHLFSYFDRQ